ncbi:hypothetical protein [Xanthomonas sacchari]|uniref:hypothetical protein n=1 Tax=Xanthomonas sacchari TaxID=56458 RepID=UPI00225452BF|nr:hypothetical protein [Xanthomonas sacchari]
MSAALDNITLYLRTRPHPQSEKLMTIAEFWNHAFLAALSRLPPEQAKVDADQATTICIEHWQANIYNFSPANFPRVQDVDIANVRWPAEGGKRIPGAFGLLGNQVKHTSDDDQK